MKNTLLSMLVAIPLFWMGCGEAHDPTDLSIEPSQSERGQIIDKIKNGSTLTVPSQDDIDLDSISDEVDNCPTTPNPEQRDVDGNGVGDDCEKATS